MYVLAIWMRFIFHIPLILCVENDKLRSLVTDHEELSITKSTGCSAQSEGFVERLLMTLPLWPRWSKWCQWIICCPIFLKIINVGIKCVELNVFHGVDEWLIANDVGKNAKFSIENVGVGCNVTKENFVPRHNKFRVIRLLWKLWCISKVRWIR